MPSAAACALQQTAHQDDYCLQGGTSLAGKGGVRGGRRLPDVPRDRPLVRSSPGTGLPLSELLSNSPLRIPQHRAVLPRSGGAAAESKKPALCNTATRHDNNSCAGCMGAQSLKRQAKRSGPGLPPCIRKGQWQRLRACSAWNEASRGPLQVSAWLILHAKAPCDWHEASGRCKQ